MYSNDKFCIGFVTRSIAALRSAWIQFLVFTAVQQRWISGLDPHERLQVDIMLP